MKGLRFFVLEDDPIFRRSLVKDIRELGHEVAFNLANLDDAYIALKDCKTDIFLLDIVLDGDIEAGFKFANKVSKFHKPIIFSTSKNCNKTYLRAKEFPLSFLVIKPFDKITLQSTIDVLIDKAYKSLSYRSMEVSNGGYIFVTINNKYYKLCFDDIYHIRASGNYCYVQAKGVKHVIQKSLKKVEGLLSSENFHRIHRNYIVNLKHITFVDVSARVVLVNGEAIPIGDHYKNSFLQKLNTI